MLLHLTVGPYLWFSSTYLFKRMNVRSSISLLPLCTMLACAGVGRNIENGMGEAKQPPGLMDRGLHDCAGVMRARYAGLLEDPDRVPIFEEFFGSLPGEDTTKPDDGIDPAMSETLYGIAAPHDELLYDVDWKSAEIDWAYFENDNWQLEKYPVLREFRDSLNHDMTRKWYIYIWKILDERGELPQDQSERRVAPIRLMERFAIELKNHLVEHGFGDDDWLRPAMCSDDYNFFERFMDFYLYELLENGLPHEGAFQSARADVGVERRNSE